MMIIITLISLLPLISVTKKWHSLKQKSSFLFLIASKRCLQPINVQSSCLLHLGSPQIFHSSFQVVGSVPSKSTKMSSGFTICTSHVTGPADPGSSSQKPRRSSGGEKNKSNKIILGFLRLKVQAQTSKIPVVRKFGKKICPAIVSMRWRLCLRQIFLRHFPRIDLSTN